MTFLLATQKSLCFFYDEMSIRNEDVYANTLIFNAISFHESNCFSLPRQDTRKSETFHVVRTEKIAGGIKDPSCHVDSGENTFFFSLKEANKHASVYPRCHRVRACLYGPAEGGPGNPPVNPNGS